jgi:hypothetical protein
MGSIDDWTWALAPPAESTGHVGARTGAGVDNAGLRFVVLHHTGVERPHHDLMFERPSRTELITFRLAAWPVPGTAAAEALAAHRAAYLEYEGPVSNGRGEVRRVAQGQYRVRRVDDRRVALELDGEQWGGTIVISYGANAVTIQVR